VQELDDRGAIRSLEKIWEGWSSGAGGIRPNAQARRPTMIELQGESGAEWAAKKAVALDFQCGRLC